jgi:hypothetical protein
MNASTPQSLAPFHLGYLVDHTIDPNHPEASPLFGADRAAIALGLGRRHVLVSSAIGIIYRNAPGYVRYRLFEDDGRPVDGKGDVPRFLCPADKPVPVFITQLAGSSPSLVVTESPFKAIAAAQAGIPALGLGGTGTTLRTDSQEPRLNETWLDPHGKVVTICFDAGRATNACVARDEAKLAQALEAAGAAEVLLAALPLDPRGGDWGPDDFIKANGADALRKVIAAAVPANPVKRLSLVADSDAADALLDDLPFLISVIKSKASVQDRVRDWFRRKKKAGALRGALKEAESRLQADRRTSAPDECYAVVDGRLAMMDAKGEPRFLTNFAARIIAETAADPGAERLFLIEGATEDGIPLPRVLVSASEFPRDDWWLARWGAKARREPGRGVPDLIRAAIQALSTDIRTIHASVGWIYHSGRPAFLHAGGAIGAEGVDISLDGPLQRIHFPEDTSNAIAGVHLDLQFLHAAPLAMTVPILATTYGAVLQHFYSFNGIVHLFGPTGTLKTSMALFAMQHFGDFDSGSLLGWLSTFAAIETHLHRAKDVLSVLDDFAPTSADPSDPMRRKAMDLIRSIGNGTGKLRMRPDMSQRPAQPPRGMILSTGEDLPSHESIRARTFAVAVKPGDVNLPALSPLQEHSGLLPSAMRAFIEWVQRSAEVLSERLERRINALRSELHHVGGHARTPEMVAHLLARFEAFTQFAVELGALDSSYKSGWDFAARSALLESGAAQHQILREASVAELFVSGLRSLLISGEIHVVDLQSDLSEATHDVGWIDRVRGVVYLEPAAATRAARRALQQEGRSLPVVDRGLHSALQAAGHIVEHDQDHNTTKKQLGKHGLRRRVLALPARVLMEAP